MTQSIITSASICIFPEVYYGCRKKTLRATPSGRDKFTAKPAAINALYVNVVV